MFGAIILLNSTTLSDAVISIIGWLLIGIILSSLVVTWVVMLPGAISQTYESAKKCIKEGFSTEADEDKKAIKENEAKTPPEKPEENENAPSKENNANQSTPEKDEKEKSHE